MIDWSPLRSMLKRYRANSFDLPIWWRDDDAITPTPALEQLSTLSTDLGLSVHLAIIPKLADQELVQYLQGRSHLIPLYTVGPTKIQHLRDSKIQNLEPRAVMQLTI